MLKQLGPYRLDRQIGRGGMGAVYAGVNEESGETAAIKILAAAFAENAGFRSRFLSEIETLKQLRHPNIVQLYGDGEQDGQLFYVMELVDGKSLQEELQAGHHYDWEETTEIAIQICQALKHAHDHGVIHRDLKPANLLRTPDNQIKLTDFGIAKLFGATDLTAAGSVVGTADFMSPEQAEGRGVTYRSDLYSLGTVMFTLLARRPPFAGASLPQVVHKLRYEPAPSVRRYNPQVPAELEQIIDQLLSKTPEDRVATALVLANRLKAMKHGLANLQQPAVPAPASPPISDEQATRISNSQQSPNTELNPTAVNEPASRGGGARSASWNEATVATGDDLSGNDPTGQMVSEGAADAGPASEGVAERVSQSKKTVVETKDPVNRFTTIEAEQRRKQQETGSPAARWWEVTKVILLAVSLVVVVAAVAWGLRPKTADQLYADIVRTAASTSVEDARKPIEEFLDRFPEDPRATEVQAFQLEIHSERHFSNLARRARKETLSAAQTTYVQAMKDRVAKPRAARDAFLKLLREHESAATNEETQRCVEYARYQLKRLDDA